jgi:dTDP-4-amino-4,6-dideoxygalactose transaminase
MRDSAMKIPFLDISQKIFQERAALHDALDRVLDSRVFILGKEVADFEMELAQQLSLNADCVVSCNSGTDALVLGMKAMGVKTGSEVIVPAHTAVPTVAAIRALGAIPRFAEVDPETWVMDTTDALSLLTEKTSAIIPVHLYGNSVKLNALEEQRKIVLEDVAQAQGGTYDGKPLGTWGRSGAFSFYPTKNLGALGDGGALACREQSDATKARSLRFYGQSSRYRAELDGGINSRLDELQAAFLRLRLPSYHSEIQNRERLRKAYIDAFSGMPIRFQKITEGCIPAWHLFVVAFETQEIRDRVRLLLEPEEIGSLVHYPVPNHLQPALQAFRERSLPVTEMLCSTILSLPFHSALTLENVARVSEVVARALQV